MTASESSNLLCTHGWTYGTCLMCYHDLVGERQSEIERLRALVKKAGDLLTYGGPDMELQSDDGSDWLDQCDKWFKAANYCQPKPMPAVETIAVPYL